MSKKKVILYFIILIPVFVKLWLVETQSLVALPDFSYDDMLFVKLADRLAAGKWLGSCDKLTLSKGLFYPIWIALTYYFRIPLLLSEHLLNIGVICLFTISGSPIFKKDVHELILFIVLLFNPLSYDNRSMTRVIRDGIYLALMLMTLACAFGLTLRWQRDWVNLLIWSEGFGLSLGAFWLTREESVWLVPSIIIIVFISLIFLYKHNKKKIIQTGGLWVVSIAVSLLMVGIVSGRNYFNYGVFAKTEFDSSVFNKAYRSLTRVKTKKFIPLASVTSSARSKIYAVSPTFALLGIYLEGKIGKIWVKNSWPKTDENENEILGEWFVWASRDASD